MNKPFDDNRDAAAQEYNRYRTTEPVTSDIEDELRTIPENDLDIINPTMRDEEGIQPITSEDVAVREANAELEDEHDVSPYSIDLDVAETPIDTGNDLNSDPLTDLEDVTLDDEFPDIPDADLLDGETPVDPAAVPLEDQDAHGTDILNGSTGEDEPDRFGR